ncbi:MAG: class I SAM-dependent methyltransferase [Deltaproteobacteria bacterium]|nr:MAG: class I SAM-dependent methyltransferase [Deltaproteobacteria bacterium]
MRTLSFLLLLVACGESPAPEAPTDGEVKAHHGEGHHDGHAAHGEMRPHHGGDHATVSHRFDDPEKWAKTFDDPERDAWQKPEAVVGQMAIEPGMTVADIGAGTGYFNPHLAQAVGAEGTVIAADIEESLVAHMTARAEKDGTPQVKPRLGAPDDPKLAESEVDRVLLVDTYHHINERKDYFGRLKTAFKPGGTLTIVDFKPGDIPVGPPEDHRIPKEKVVAELEEAGWKLASDEDVLPHQFVLVFAVAE